MNQQENQSDERFVAFRVDHVGVDELNPELKQIRDIVAPFLPSTHKFCYTVKATREIVNGVKYEIVFVMTNEHDDEIFCEMDVLEKPWLIRDSRKFRKMTYNNCSLTIPTNDEDRMRFQYDINPTFVNQKTFGDLKDMEDQIITTRPRKPSIATTSTSTTAATVEESDEDDATLAPLNPSSKNLLDDFFNMNMYFPPPPKPAATSTTTTSPQPNLNLDALDEMFGLRRVENSQAEPKISDDESSGDENLQQKRVESVDAAVPTRNETALKELESEIKKVFSELFQTDPEFQTNIIALINRKDDTNAQKNYNYVISILASKLKDKIETFNDRKPDESDDVQVTVNPNASGDIRRKRSYSTMIWELAEEALETLDHFDGDDDKRILINILNVRESDGKSSIKIEATVANSKCQENSHEIGKCDEQIDQNTIKICLLEVKLSMIFCT